LPGDSTIIYASTHEADANCPPPPDRSKGYVWKLYETFDIYSANADGTNIIKLTDAYGYDAEATVSPLGDKIAVINSFVFLSDTPSLQVFDFNSTTGEIDNPISLSSAITLSSYGLEFYLKISIPV